MEDLALQPVRKLKAKKTHLTVPASAEADIRTLCGVAMAAGDYEIIDGPADCQPCLRKRSNRAFISSAYFAQDAGTRLLEMSLEQARAGRAGRPTLRVVEEEAAARPAGGNAKAGARGGSEAGARAKSEGKTGSKPRTASETKATSAAKAKPGARGSTSRAADPGVGDEDALTEDELRALGLTSLKRVGLAVYQSPAGVLVRLHRDAGSWRIAEVTFDGPVSLTARASGRNTTVVGDVRLEETDGGLRLKLTSGRR